MTNDLYEKLVNELLLQPVDRTLPATKSQHIKCLICNNIFQAAPKGKVRGYKKYHMKGCQDCSRKEVYKDVVAQNRLKLEEKFEILSDFGENNKDCITVKNKTCSHTFTTKRDYLLYSEVECPECEIQNRGQRFIDINKSRTGIFKPRKVTFDVFMQRLEDRNKQCPDRKVFLVTGQVYAKQEDRYTFSCEKNHTWSTNGLSVIWSHSGCPYCADLLAADRYLKPISKVLEDFQKVHGDKYSYPNLEEEYKGSHDLITIDCKNHGIYRQRAYCHVAGQGCPRCIPVQYSKASIRWLNYIIEQDEIFIQHAENGGEYFIPDTRYHVDGYCEETNTIYEFYGDTFHGNPNLFEDHEYCSIDKSKTAKELYERTMNREIAIKNIGYNFISIWENDWNILEKQLKSSKPSVQRIEASEYRNI